MEKYLILFMGLVHLEYAVRNLTKKDIKYLGLA